MKVLMHPCCYAHKRECWEAIHASHTNIAMQLYSNIRHKLSCLTSHSLVALNSLSCTFPSTRSHVMHLLTVHAAVSDGPVNHSLTTLSNAELPELAIPEQLHRIQFSWRLLVLGQLLSCGICTKFWYASVSQKPQLLHEFSLLYY
jgi:hypothetical protein